MEEAGITLESLSVSGGNANQIAALVSGNADFYLGTIDGLASAVREGQGVRMFCGLITEQALPLFARPDLDLSTFDELEGNWNETVSQFDGLKIGVPARGSSYELRTAAILASGGVSPEDVTFVPVGIGPAVVAAIDAGQIDALLGYPFLPQQFTESGVMELIVDANADGPEKIRGQFSTGLISTAEWIESNADQASALCESIDPINDAVMDPANEEVVRSMLVENAVLSGPALDGAYDFVSDDFYGPEIPEEGVQKAVDIMVDAGSVEAGTGYDELVKKPE